MASWSILRRTGRSTGEEHGSATRHPLLPGDANALDGLGVSGDDDLVCQQRVPVGKVEHGLMGKLLRMVGPGSSLQDESWSSE